jgi:L-fuculokinase
VLSTGTWVIAAAFGMPLDGLREQADMLANTNALGQPWPACASWAGANSRRWQAPQPKPAAFGQI